MGVGKGVCRQVCAELPASGRVAEQTYFLCVYIMFVFVMFALHGFGFVCLCVDFAW